MRKVWKNALLGLSAFVMFTALGACDGANTDKTATIAPQTYRVAKTGESISLADVTAKDSAGNAVSVTVQVTDEQGKTVAVKNGAFTPTADGKYKVVCTASAKDCAPVEFYVYATADGSAYALTAPENVPQTVEWGTECVLPLAYGEHVVNGDQIADIVVRDKDGNSVHTAPDRFVADKLGAYTVEYRLGDKKETYEIVCEDTSAPVVVLRNNMTTDPKYGANFLLPYIGVIDASEDESKRTVKVYSEDTDREMAISSNNRITIDASRYFIYEIYAEDTSGRGATYQFRIDRKYDAAIDAIPVTLTETGIAWENTATREFVGYPTVTGYEISLDGGETFNVSVDSETFAYTIAEKSFCSVIVREITAGGVECAVSSELPYDGALERNELASFAVDDYLQIMEVGSYTPFDWNSNYSMAFKYNPNGYRGVTGGVMLAQSNNYSAMNIRFPKAQKVVSDSVLVIKMYASDVEKWVRIAGFGKDSIGVPMSDFGWQPATWQEISLPVTSTFGVKVGDTLEGVQILFKELVAIADIRMISLQEGLSGNQVANFDLAQYEAMVTVPSEWGSGSALGFGARFYMKQSIELDGYGDVTDGVLKMYSSGYAGVRIEFPRKVQVTDNSFLVLKLYTDTNHVPRLRKYGTAGDSGSEGFPLDAYGLQGKKWQEISVPVTAFGYEDGETLEGVEFTYYIGSAYIDEISVVDFSNVETLVVGDSYTSKTYWKKLETDLADIGAFTIGVGGTTVDEWAEKIDVIKSYNPKNIVIHVGVNDINRGESGAACGAAIIELIKAIQAELPQAKVFYIAISENKNYPQKWEEYAKSNAVVQAYLAKTPNAYYIDFFTAQREHNDEWANGGYIEGDGTHLTQEAYAHLTEMVLQAVQSNGWQDGNDFGAEDIY